jgi:hypothetical protein
MTENLTPGSRLGPYEIVAPIGAGGRGEVYKARDTRLDRAVADGTVKVLDFGLARATAPDVAVANSPTSPAFAKASARLRDRSGAS